MRSRLCGYMMLEILLGVFIVGLLATMGLGVFRDRLELGRASLALAYHIELARSLALSDTRYYAALEDARGLARYGAAIRGENFYDARNAWLYEIVFHTGDEKGYSIFADTPRRKGLHTHYDHRPMASDIIAKNQGSATCLTIYNNANTDKDCKDNVDTSLRLSERYGIGDITFSGDSYCFQSAQAVRVYFDRAGMPLCSTTPRRLSQRLVITLHIGGLGLAKKSLSIYPSGLVRID